MLRCVLKLDRAPGFKSSRLTWAILEQGPAWNDVRASFSDTRGGARWRIQADYPDISSANLWLRSLGHRDRDRLVSYLPAAHGFAMIRQRQYLSALVALARRLNDTVELVDKVPGGR